jgi:hypothetical protein
MGLNESYSHVQGQILLIDPLPSINKVFSLVVQEERQRLISFSSLSFNQNTTTLLIKAAPSSRFMPNRSYQNRKDKPICSHCGIPGHIVEKCYRVHGFPPSFKFNKGRNAQHLANQVSDYTTHYLPITYEQCQQVIDMFKPLTLKIEFSANQASLTNQIFANLTQGDTSSNLIDAGNFLASQLSFLDTKHFAFASSTSLIQQNSLTNSVKAPSIIDIGAIDYMICSISFFTSITYVISKTVRLPNGQHVSVTNIGIIKILESFILIVVLCIPSFSFNLISVSKFIKSLQCCFIFLSKFCFIQHLTSWTTIGVGEEAGGLYHLLQNPVFVLPLNSINFNYSSSKINNVVTSLASTSIFAEFVNTSLWHFRLGHHSDVPLKMFSY